MSVFDSLAKEHALLLRLVGRLERAASEPDGRAAARETRNILLVLFKALEAHEALEHLVFDDSPDAPPPAAYAALAKVEAQHESLAALRKEAAALLGSVSLEGVEPVRELALNLAKLLRRHFDDEERTLWPGFHAYARRSTLHRLSRQAAEQLKLMERDVTRYWAEVEEYTKGGL